MSLLSEIVQCQPNTNNSLMQKLIIEKYSCLAMSSNLQVVQFLGHCSSFFGILPDYNWQNRIVTSNGIQKLTAVVKIAYLFLSYLLGFEERLEFTYKYRPPVIVVLHTISIIVELTLNCSDILISVFGNVQKWELLLSFIAKRVVGKVRTCKFTILYLTCHALFLTLMVPISYRWMMFADATDYWKFFGVAPITVYNTTTLIFLYVFTAYSTKQELREVNSKLCQMEKGNNVHKDTYIEEIKQLKNEFKFLYRIVDAQNSTYGFQVLFLLGSITIYLQCAACASITMLEYGTLNGELQNGMVSLNSSMSAYKMVG